MKPSCLLIAAALLAGCGGRTPLLLTDGAARSGGDSSDPSQAGVRPGSYDAGDPACLAGCSTPPGPLQVDLSEADIVAAIVGVWRICYGSPGLFVSAPSDTIGVEFAPPHTRDDDGDFVGNLYLLVQGGSGPLRGDGVAYHQTYQVIGNYVMCDTDRREYVYQLAFKYSPCPRELWLEDHWHGHSGALASF